MIITFIKEIIGHMKSNVIKLMELIGHNVYSLIDQNESKNKEINKRHSKLFSMELI
jgi:hypothetical protein